MAKEDISVHMPSLDLQVDFSPESVHKDSSPCSGVPTQQRDTMRHLSRRHSPSRSGHDQAYRAHSNNIVATQSLGFRGELSKLLRTDTESDLPGLNNLHSNDESEPFTGKDGCDCQGGESSSRAAEGSY